MGFSLDENSIVTWWLMLLLSTFMLVIFLIMIPDAVHKYEIASSGQLSTVKIIIINRLTLGNKHTISLHFKYLDDKEKFINISKNFSNTIKNKEETQLQHLPKYPNLFLAPDYDIRWQSISHVALICFFSFMVPFSIYKIRTLRW